MTQPQLSICIPNYNKGPWVASAIRSALMQPAVQVVVVDNASTDTSQSEIGQFQDRRLAVHLCDDHVSMYENIRRAVELCSAPWCLVLCSDDELTASFYDTFARTVVQHREAVLVSQAAIDPDGPALIGGARPRVYTDPLAVLASPMLPVSTTAFAREAYDDIGGFSADVGWFADWDLWVRMVMQAGPAVAVGSIGALYHRSRGSWATAERSAREVEWESRWLDHRRAQWPPGLIEAMEFSLTQRSERVGRHLLAHGDKAGLELLRTAAGRGSSTAARRLALERYPVAARGYDTARAGMRRAVRKLVELAR